MTFFTYIAVGEVTLFREVLNFEIGFMSIHLIVLWEVIGFNFFSKKIGVNILGGQIFRGFLRGSNVLKIIIT